MKDAKSYHLKQIKRVRTPTADNCLTVKHWELKVERWKCELQVVVEEHNNRKKRSSEVADKTSSSVKQTKSPKPVWPIQQDNKPNPHKCSKGVKRSQMDCKSKYYNWNTSGRDRDYRQPSTQSKSCSDNRYRAKRGAQNGQAQMLTTRTSPAAPRTRKSQTDPPWPRNPYKTKTWVMRIIIHTNLPHQGRHQTSHHKRPNSSPESFHRI